MFWRRLRRHYGTSYLLFPAIHLSTSKYSGGVSFAEIQNENLTDHWIRLLVVVTYCWLKYVPAMWVSSNPREIPASRKFSGTTPPNLDRVTVSDVFGLNASDETR